MVHNQNEEHPEHSDPAGQAVVTWYKSPLGIVLLGAALALGYYLWVYHSQHVLAFLPFIFILACPLMHLLMHRNHGHRHQSETAAIARAGRLSLLIVTALFIGTSYARAGEPDADHAAHHPKQEVKAPSTAVTPTTKPAETLEELRAKIAKLEAQLKEKSGSMGMGMMMGDGKQSGMGGGMCCCMNGAMMKGEQQQAPTTQPHSHDHK